MQKNQVHSLHSPFLSSTGFLRYDQRAPEKHEPSAENATELAEAQTSLDREAPDLPADLDAIVLTHWAEPNAPTQRSPLVDHLLAKVPEVRTQKDLDAFVQTALEFKQRPGMDELVERLVQHAAKQSPPLILPGAIRSLAIARLERAYPNPYSEHRLLSLGDRWGTNPCQYMEALLKPLRDNQKRPWPGQHLPAGYLPPGLLSALTHLEKPLQEASFEQLKDMLDLLATQCPEEAIRVTLLPSLLKGIVSHFEKRARTGAPTLVLEPADESHDKATRIHGLLLWLCEPAHLAANAPCFIDGHLLQLKNTYTEESREPTRQKQAAERCLAGLRALLPHVESMEELAKIEALVRSLPPGIDASDYMMDVIWTEIRWALGLPDESDKHHPTVNRLSNLLRILLVAPSAAAWLNTLEFRHAKYPVSDRVTQVLKRMALTEWLSSKTLMAAIDRQAVSACNACAQVGHERALVKQLAALVEGLSVPARQAVGDALCQNMGVPCITLTGAPPNGLDPNGFTGALPIANPTQDQGLSFSSEAMRLHWSLRQTRTDRQVTYIEDYVTWLINGQHDYDKKKLLRQYLLTAIKEHITYLQQQLLIRKGMQLVFNENFDKDGNFFYAIRVLRSATTDLYGQ